jgi:hypothetical protein
MILNRYLVFWFYLTVTPVVAQNSDLIEPGLSQPGAKDSG